ncbi:MAG: type IX secretion system membrane protein PorP/SprF [candidate division KSB1 bacterium]|nr:type IX secretion system membrane protein PorP/SprF [candidate division KSB1 bacterium]
MEQRSGRPRLHRHLIRLLHHIPYFYYILPLNTGIGLTGQSFNSAYFDQGNYSLLLSRDLSRNLSCGIKFNVFTKHYKNLDLKDPGDPVFAGKGSRTKAVFSLGAGFFFQPVYNLMLGFSMDHFTHPDVTLMEDGLHQPLVTDFGIRYRFRSLGSFMNLSLNNDELYSTTFGIESYLWQTGVLRMGYVSSMLRFEGQLNIGEKMSLNYSLDYPFNDINDVSYGSHQLGFVFRFDGTSATEANFTVRSSVNTLNMTVAYDSIFVDQGITPQTLDELANYGVNLFEKDVLQTIRKGAEVTKQSLGKGNMPPSSDPYFDEYKKKILDQIKIYGVDLDIEIMSPPGTGEKAIAFLNYLVDSVGVSSDRVRIFFSQNGDNQSSGSLVEALKAKMADVKGTMKRVVFVVPERPEFSTDHTVFEIIPTRSSQPIFSWRLIIENSNQEVIKSFGGNRFKSRISWDWKDNNNQYIRHDNYYWYFQWKEKSSSDWKPSRDKVKKEKLSVVGDEIKKKLFLSTPGGFQPPASGMTPTEGTSGVKVQIPLRREKERRQVG